VSKLEQREFPENPEIVEFPKSEPFNRKTSKISVGKSNETEIPGKKFPNTSVLLAGLSFIPEFPVNDVPFTTRKSNWNFSSNGKRTL